MELNLMFSETFLIGFSFATVIVMIGFFAIEELTNKPKAEWKYL